MLIFLRRGQTKNLPPPFPGLENPEVEAACVRRSSPCQLGSLSTAKVSAPIYFLSKQYFHCILAAMRTSPTSSIQKQGHWCVSCINSVKNTKSSIVVIMLVSRWKVPIPSASSPRPKEFPLVSGLASTSSPPTWQHLYSTWNSRQLPSYFYIFCKTVCSTASPVLLQPPRWRRPMSPFHLHSHSMDPGRESQNLLTFVFRRFWATWRKSLDLERAAWLSWVDLEENIPRFTSVQSSINVDIEVICLLGLKEFCGKPC